MGSSTGPQRTCVGCGVRAPKISLLRLVKGPEGLEVSPSGPGRGAYLHQGCVDAPEARGRLARMLRSRLDPGEIARLRAYIEGKR